MGYPVPQFPPVIDVTEGAPTANADVRAALPVRANGQWADWTAACNWALAKGGTLITCGPSSGAVPGNSQTYRFWIHPRSQIVARLWVVSLSMRHAATTVALHHATGQIQVPTGTPIGSYVITPDDYGRTRTFEFVQLLGSPSATPAEVTMQMTVDASSGTPGVFMDGVSCYEIRRGVIETFGPNPSTLGGFPAPATAAPTVETGATIRGHGYLARSVDSLMTTATDRTMLQVESRRSCLHSWYRPTGQTVGTTYENLNIRNPPVLARTRYGQTVTEVAISVYGVGPAGSNVRFTAERSGDVTTLVLPTSLGWVHGLIDVDGEQPNTWQVDGGLRGTSDRDTIKIEAQRVGAGTCTVYGGQIAESVATAD